MLKVYHLGVSQSERIVWLCEELGLGYELLRYDRDPDSGLAPAAYKALHPSGTAPVIADGDLVLAESGAIVEYLLTRYGNERLSAAPEAANYADYLYWLHFANGSFMPAFMMELVVKVLGGGDTAATQALRSRLDHAYDLLEQRLGLVPWLAGAEFTAADIMMVFGLTTGRLFVPRDLSPYSNILAYLQRVGERPAYRRAMSEADPQLSPQLT
jgi:glutathione S-transferase